MHITKAEKRFNPIFWLYVVSLFIISALSIGYIVCFIVGLSQYSFPLYFWDMVSINPLAFAAGIFAAVAIMEIRDETSSTTRIVCNILAALAIVVSIGFIAGMISTSAGYTWRCIFHQDISSAAANAICNQASVWNLIFWILKLVNGIAAFFMTMSVTAAIYLDIARIHAGRVLPPLTFLAANNKK